MDGLVAIELQADQFLGGQGSDEQVVLPFREAVAVIKSHAAQSRRLFPDMMRRHRALDRLTLGFGDGQQRVVDTVGRQRPAVILATLDDIDFVAATRTVLVGPQGAGPGIEGGALLVAVPERPDFGTHAGLADKGVVVGNPTIGEDPHHLALQLVQVLRGRPLIVFAEGDEQVAIAVEHQSRAEMVAGRQFGLLPEDHLEIDQPRPIFRQPPAPDHGTGLVTLATALGIGQVDQTILLERRRQHHVQQSPLALGPNLRNTTQWRRELAICTHHPQIPRSLGHQHALSVRQKCQRPGVLEAADDLGRGDRPQLRAERLRRGQFLMDIKRATATFIAAGSECGYLAGSAPPSAPAVDAGNRCRSPRSPGRSEERAAPTGMATARRPAASKGVRPGIGLFMRPLLQIGFIRDGRTSHSFSWITP